MNSLRASKFTKAGSACGMPGNCQAQTASVQPEILLVEDGSGLFPKIGDMLQSRGFQVILAPNADMALQEMLNNDIAAVIAGASREQFAGLQVLAAVKEKRAEVKTMVVTRLVDPGLPVQAYEMDIDDYIHWPLSSAELTGRLRSLLEPGVGENSCSLGNPEYESNDAHTFAEIGSLVDRFTDSLAMISQSLEDIRQEHREGMAAELSDDLFSMASLVQNLSDNMRQCWHFEADEPALRDTAQARRFH